MVAYLRNLTRVESWSFFEPQPGGGDPTYSFLGNRATFGIRATSARVDVEGAFQYAQILGLPPRSIGPGALGTGALYYDAAQFSQSYQLYLKTIAGRLKNVLPGLSVTAGRMSYASGAEAASGVPAIEAVKRQRLDARLIGGFEWSLFERSFDGARVDFDRRTWSATAALMFPTQGGFEESANPTISSVRVATAALTMKPARLGRSELQLFGYHYQDRRDVRGRPDNMGRLARRADITLATVGASHVRVAPLSGGELDTLVWVAGQTGDWYGQPHRAFSVAAEGGYRWPAAWEPWVRGGLLMASGDDDPGDDRHGTFFQMLPTVSRYALSATYSQMNMYDVFGQALLRPAPRVRARLDLHYLALADAADRWYCGSGATARTGAYFGFSGRPSNGARSLGTVVEGSIDVALAPHWSIDGYAGFIRGGEVVRRLFAGRHLRFWYVESVIQF